ncbi:hypothetical protein HOH51_02100 [bacterium]|nr:hypothetical protein [bacterium]
MHSNTKKITIIVIILALCAYFLPYLTNSDLFKGTVGLNSVDAENCQVVNLGNGRYVKKITTEEGIEVYVDIPAGDACMPEGA